MDLAGLRPLFGKNVDAATSLGPKFIGRLEPIANSSSAVTLLALDAATAAQYDYAINGVAALDINSIVYIQPLAP